MTSILSAAGWRVRWCPDGSTAIAAAETGRWPSVLLDLGLPDLDGVDVCRALRRRLPDAAILIVTARDAEIDLVVGLEAGGDDYLVKPVRSAELLARLRAHLRRVDSRRDDSHRDDGTTVGSLHVHPATRRAWVGENELVLRAKEFDLLDRLTREPGRAVSRESLMADVWDDNWFGSTKTLDVHIAALRRRLVDAAASCRTPAPRITTLRGFGYRLDEGEDHRR